VNRSKHLEATKMFSVHAGTARLLHCLYKPNSKYMLIRNQTDKEIPLLHKNRKESSVLRLGLCKE